MLDLTTVLLTLFIVSFIIYYKLNQAKRSKNGLPLPPCLPSLPFIGSALFLPSWKKIPSYFTECSNKYGPVIGFYLGNRFCLIINDQEKLREAFVVKSSNFSCRSNSKFSFLNPDHKGIFSRAYDNEFKKDHMFYSKLMHKLSFGNSSHEYNVRFEIEKLLENINKLKGQEFDPSRWLRRCFVNIMSRILFGERFDEDDPKLEKLVFLIGEYLDQIGDTFIMELFSFLRYVPYFRNLVKNCISHNNEIMDMIEGKIKSLRGQNYDNVRPNFISEYIKTLGPNFDKQQIMHLLLELFIASTDTTTNTVEWACILLANNQSIQEKIRKEINQNIISGSFPILEIRQKLIFVEAFMLEVFRFKSIAPLSMPHRNVNDAQLGGYFIPADTLILGNLHCIHHNLKIWGDPENFRPERFIEDGRIENRNNVIPFSIGPRSCFGETMARKYFFLTITALVQMFNLLPPMDQSEIKFDDKFNFTLKPIAFKMRMEPLINFT